MQNILPVLLLFIVLNLLLLILLLWAQSRLRRQREKHQIAVKDIYQRVDTQVAELQRNHALELEQLHNFYKDQPKVLVPSESKEMLANAKEEAEVIVAEAQERAKLLLHKQEQELQKSLVKIVIQVTKKVVGKTLNYDDHKQLILDTIGEIA